ncbi:protein AUXIN-REGULATED GENE INVOLVED IN ORGAN SIZE [Sesamum indicum]|uniref:Protein AUXIN-REGULATED GENE INVOLVED IN ORGAN SIZE n=1 Tax=Sesamum indicum TaxID=4182 RepID=A0A6I9SXF8_SESIN|nr:protein AUXIN-REGULATED GENE INVOLVED IN ORGAN SIZE [Sesamum indicum]
MTVKQQRSKSALSKGYIDLQDQHLRSIMDGRMAKSATRQQRKSSVHMAEGQRLEHRLEHCRSFSQGHSGKMSRYFTLESLFLLVCLTVSLLILPLVLPPLPPPPFLLLLLPICILALLMILAFMPSNVRDTTYV